MGSLRCWRKPKRLNIHRKLLLPLDRLNLCELADTLPPSIEVVKLQADNNFNALRVEEMIIHLFFF